MGSTEPDASDVAVVNPKYGPEYGMEAVRRLEAGFSIVYSLDKVLVEEHPDGRRFAIRVEYDGSFTNLRELATGR
jgi:hypothetical protein